MRFASRSTLQACADNKGVADSELLDSQQVEDGQEIQDSQQLLDSQNSESQLDVSSWVRMIPRLISQYRVTSNICHSLLYKQEPMINYLVLHNVQTVML